MRFDAEQSPEGISVGVRRYLVMVLAVMTTSAALCPAGPAAAATNTSVSMSHSPHIVVSRGLVMVDEPVDVRLRGFIPGQQVQLVLTLVTGSNEWTSQALFAADDGGRVDLAADAPIAGDYTGVDPMGLIWSAHLVGTSTTARARTVDRYRASQRTCCGRRGRDGRPHPVLPASGRHIDRRARPRTCRHVLRAPGRGRHPAVVVLGGSEGGKVFTELIAALLASHGYDALALAYFDPTGTLPGLPRTLSLIPLEYFGTAIDWLAAPTVGRRQPHRRDRRIPWRRARVAARLALSPDQSRFRDRAQQRCVARHQLRAQRHRGDLQLRVVRTRPARAVPAVQLRRRYRLRILRTRACRRCGSCASDDSRRTHTRPGAAHQWYRRPTLAVTANGRDGHGAAARTSPSVSRRASVLRRHGTHRPVPLRTHDDGDRTRHRRQPGRNRRGRPGRMVPPTRVPARAAARQGSSSGSGSLTDAPARRGTRPMVFVCGAYPCDASSRWPGRQRGHSRRESTAVTAWGPEDAVAAVLCGGVGRLVGAFDDRVGIDRCPGCVRSDTGADREDAWRVLAAMRDGEAFDGVAESLGDRAGEAFVGEEDHELFAAAAVGIVAAGWGRAAVRQRTVNS